MKTKKILAGALAAAVVATSLPGMGVPVFAQTEYGTTLFENRYTDTKPFAFPTEENATATLEAELATSLNNDDTGDRPDQNHYYPMKMVLDDDGVTAIHDMASGGRDYATYAYTAEVGLYEVVANCQCGSTNTMVLSEANDKISKVTVEVAETRDNQRNLIWGTSNKFLLWVNESGAGTLRINSADNQAAPRIDCLTITKVKSPYYVGENRFQFPTDSSSVTLEAEYGILTNVTNSADTNGRWPAMVSPASWASKGYFVNSVNTGDSVAYAYHAEKPGIYEFTATYRSGSEKNHYTWSSTNNKIVAGSVQAGHGNANETQTKTFKVVVKEAGDGILTFAAPTPAANVENMAQTDKFDITLVVDKSDLVSAIAKAEALNLNNYEDGETKTAFTTALTAAKAVNTDYADTLTQTTVNDTVTALNAAKAALVSKTTGIQIVTRPTKTVYNLNENLNTAGLTVDAVKANNTYVELTEADYTVTGFDSAETGRKTLTVTLKANPSLTINTDVEVVDGARLDAKVAEAKTKTAGKHYTSATKTAFNEKLAAAKAVQNDIKAANGDSTVTPSATAVTADRVAQATAALDSAMNDLEEMYKVTVPAGAEITVADGVEKETGNGETNKWVYVPVATKVTVTAPKTNDENKKFAAWTWDKQKLSESNEYAFYVVGDMELQMTYDANTVDEAEVVLVGSTKYTTGKRSFIAKRSVSKKCKKVLEYGVVVTDQKGWDTYYKEGIANKKDLVKGSIRTKCSKKVAATGNLLAYNGTFVANLRVTDKNEKWYGRAYVRYLDENNQEQTYYADNVIKY